MSRPGDSAYAARAFVAWTQEACGYQLHAAAEVANHVFALSQLADRQNVLPYFTVAHLTRMRDRQHRNTARRVVKFMVAAGVIQCGRDASERAAAQAHARADGQAPGFVAAWHKTPFRIAWGKLWAWAKTWQPFTPKADGPRRETHLANQAAYAVERVERQHAAMLAAGDVEHNRTRPKLTPQDWEEINESARQRLPLRMLASLGLLKRSLNRGGADPPPPTDGPGQTS